MHRIRVSMLLAAPLITLAWLPPTIVRSKWPACGKSFKESIATNIHDAAKRNGGGTAIVIGANTGPGPGGTDPMFKWLAGSDANTVLDRILFVEPVPIVFRVLKHNLKRVPRAVGLNVAIANQSGTLNMYCVGLSDSLSETRSNGLQLTTSQEATRLGVPGWATETCSLDRARLFSAKDFGRSGSFGALRALRNRTAYEALVSEHPVRVITFAVLQQSHVRSRVLYLQALPASALPLAITFEILLLATERLQRLMGALTSRGYRMCYDHKNLVARRTGAEIL